MPARNWILLSLIALQAAAAAKPIVIAHRGGAALRPENTIAAFQHSLKLGVPVLEFDMNVTSDGKIVVHHDSTVSAQICKTDSGVKPGPIGLLALAQIKTFECGSFTRPNSPDFQPVPGQHMPTLDEFLSAVKGSKAILLGETKMPPASASYAPDPSRFVDLIYAALRKHNIEDRFILQSSDYRTLDAMREKNPRIGICLLSARRYKPAYLHLARKHHATHIMLRYDDATPQQLQELRAAGVKLYSSTANSMEDWKKYVELGFDAILTDDPQGLQRFLNGN